MTTELRSIGDKIAVRRATGPSSLIAGGAGDAAAVTGVIIDRAALGWPESCVVAIPFTATLAAAATLTVASVLQHGDNSGLSDAETLATVSSGVVATGPGGGGTVVGTIEVNVPLRGAKRYLRLNYTPDLSAANTDVAALGGVVAFAGANRLPQ
jgi:hypothetical protein